MLTSVALRYRPAASGIASLRLLPSRRHASSHDVPPELLAQLRQSMPPAAAAAAAAVASPPLVLTGNADAGSASAGNLSPRTPSFIQSRRKLVATEDASSAGRNEPVLVFHELDRHGILHVLSGRSQKSSLCTSLGLLPRDVRKLDGTLRDQLPIILVRDSAILVHIEYIRAIVKHDGVVLFEGLEMDQRLRQHEFMLYLQNRLQAEATAGAPFEFVALEAILQRVLQEMQREFDSLATAVQVHLRELESLVHWERLKILLTCRKRVTAFHERLANIRNCLKELVESDADMADMYLSDKHAAKVQDRPSYAHEEMELLLENYLKAAEEISSRTAILMADMQATEDIVNIALLGQRNELVLLDLRLGIGTFAASMGGFGASILGMNLHTGLEHSPYAFWLVLGTLLSVASTSFVLVWRRMLVLLHRRL